MVEFKCISNSIYNFMIRNLQFVNLVNTTIVPKCYDNIFSKCTCVLHNTNHITCRLLELAYQFVLPSRRSPGINLRWFPFNFPSTLSTPPTFLSCTPSGGIFPKLSCGAVFTVGSHTFTLFRSRKTSVIVEMFQLSSRVPFIRRSLHFLGKIFLFLLLFLVLSVLRYFPFQVVYYSLFYKRVES